MRLFQAVTNAELLQKVLLGSCQAGKTVIFNFKSSNMPRWLRALIAGYGAKKLGGGCLSTILIFIVLYWLLGPHGCGGYVVHH